MAKGKKKKKQGKTKGSRKIIENISIEEENQDQGNTKETPRRRGGGK